MKTSVYAEYGGALGGVVNVIMRKGGNDFHGSSRAMNPQEPTRTRSTPISAMIRSRFWNASIGLRPCNSELSAAEGSFPYASARLHHRRADPEGPHLVFRGFEP